MLHRVSRGFTLVELLIVMAIVGLSVTLVASSLERTMASAQERQWVEKTLRELNRLRVKAVMSGRVQRAELDFSSGSLRLANGVPETVLLSLPEKYVYQSVQPDIQPENLIISFYPDGSATESRFVLLTPKAGRHAIRVRGLTGQVELLAADKT